MQRKQAEFLCCGDVLVVVIYKERAVARETVAPDEFEKDVLFGLSHAKVVRKMHHFKMSIKAGAQVFVAARVVGQEPLDVDDVGVAQKEGALLLLEIQEKIKVVLGDGAQHRAPSIIEGFIRDGSWCILGDDLAKSRS